MFPTETVPDGAIFAPHHFTWGVMFAMLMCAVVWDDYPREEPIGAVGPLLAALFGFLFVWPFYPALGAALSLVGVLGAVVCLLSRPLWWERYPRLIHGAALVGALIALDDAVSHAFGVWTPIDAIWRHLFVFF